MYGAAAIRHDSAMMAHHPSAAEPPRDSWGGGQVNSGAAAEANSGDVDGFRFPRHSPHRQRASFSGHSPG